MPRLARHLSALLGVLLLLWIGLPSAHAAGGDPAELLEVPPAPPAVADDGDEEVALLVKPRPGFSARQLLPAPAAGGATRSLPARALDRLGVEVIEVAAEDAESVLGALADDPRTEYAEIDGVVAITSTDGYLPHQWGLHRTEVPKVWEHTEGAGQIVAVLDTGVDRDAAEITPDRFLQGYDFITDAPGAPDAHGHGTLSTAVVAAERGTTRGVVGVCPGCSVLPVKVLDDDGFGTSSSVAAGIIWAADNGADVISMSLGGTTQSDAVADAVAYADGKGAVLVASAGNRGDEVPHYPAAYDEVVAVAGSDPDDERYEWSTHGAATDVAAPGCNISYGLDHDPVWYCGTSSAAPMVSAAAALRLSLAGDTSPAQTRQAILETAVDVGAWAGAGRVDAHALAMHVADLAGPVELAHRSTSSSLVNAGGSVNVAAQVTRDGAGVPGHEVHLQTRYSGGSWRTVGSGATGSNGRVTLSSGALQRTSDLRLRTAGSDATTLSVAAGTVTVQASVTASADRSRRQAGQPVVVSGRLSPQLGDRTVRLEQSYGRGWTAVRTVRTSSDGRYTAVFEPVIPGQSQLRVTVPSTSWYRGVQRAAGALTVTVAPRRPGGQPVVGDFNGDGRVTPGWYDDGRWTLRIRPGRTVSFTYGRPGDVPLVGDWNGDGRHTIGIVRDGEWHLRRDVSSGPGQIVFTYGRVTRGDVPLVGDWNGDGRDTIGIVRDGQWHLRDRLAGGAADRRFTYGRITRGDVPLVGDWNGDGRDTIGIVRDGQWHLRDRLAGGAADRRFTYGRVTSGDIPTVGDWNGNGRDTIGIVRDGEWHLRNRLSGGAADIRLRLP